MLNGAAKSIERHGQMELSRQLKTRREEQGLSQDEVAKAIFVSRQTISNWEVRQDLPRRAKSASAKPAVRHLHRRACERGRWEDPAGRRTGFTQDEASVVRDDRLFFAGLPFPARFLARLAGTFQLCPHEQGQYRRRGHIHRALRHRVRMAIAIDRLKKKHDIVTYREIDRFLKGEIGEEPDSEGLARKHPALGVDGKAPRWRGDWALLAGLLLALGG